GFPDARRRRDRALDRVLVALVVAAHLQRSVPRRRAAQRARAQAADLRAVRRHRCRRDDVAAGENRWHPQLGLPLLLAARRLVYGEVIGAMAEAAQRGEALDRDRRRLVLRLADVVTKRWREPDDGIWEKRGGRRQHIHSKIMAWSALDCAERLTGKASPAKKEI